MLNRRAFSDLGIHVFGFAAIIFGMIGILARDFATYWHPVQPEVPHRTTLAVVVGVIALLAGLAVQFRRTAQAGLVVLGVLYLLGAYLWLPRVVGYPKIFGTWNGLAEEIACTFGAMVAYTGLASPTRQDKVASAVVGTRESLFVSRPAWARWVALAGRVLFGVCAVSFAFGHLTALPQTAEMVPKWLPPGQRFWAIATAVAFVLAGVSLITGVWARDSSRLLTAMLLTFWAVIWLPRLLSHPAQHMVWGGNAITLAVAGAAWMVFDSLNQVAGPRGA